MHREHLLKLLHAHRPFDETEAAMLASMLDFVQNEPRCFERALEIGHVTGSAWIVDEDFSHALLTHHAKLNRWLQLGGHADGETDILQVALREAREESGLESVTPLSENIFDVDVHPIPARGDLPQHLHYDVRFLLGANRGARLTISDESHDLAWVPLEEIALRSPGASVARMVEKMRLMRQDRAAKPEHGTTS
ncbi:MAG TPA: NUDIX hydrolase [Abditibacteriaceae bacterium]|jgi:8-oxo-dGTP pyrophosphatase MutT (NUDIX family)